MPRTLDRMSTLDAEFFYAEHANVPLHIGSVAVFDGPAPTRQDLMRLFESKLPRVPRYRQVVRATLYQLLRPAWTDDPDFAIRHHVRQGTVPAPGGPDQLRAVAAKLFAMPLDRSRPLWEEWLLDGLDGGRWAIVSKIHHCMVDGMGGNDLMAAVFDASADERPPDPAAWVPAPQPSLAALAADDLREAIRGPLRRLAAAPGLVLQAKPEDIASYGRGLGASARRLAEPSAAFLNGPIGPRRRWTWTTVSLAELKQIRATRGGTINDVVLAAITAAFRDLLAERGELTEGLVVRSLVPVSVRGPDEAGAITNRVSAVLANLPAGEPDPLRRLGLLRQQMDNLKHSHQAVGAEILTGMLGFAAPMWLALGTQTAFRIRQPLVQTVTTNVAGPRNPLYVLGRRLTALYPYVPIGNAVRISVAILSYVDDVTFGVTADYESSSDLDVFVTGIEHGLAELSGLPPAERVGHGSIRSAAGRRPVGCVTRLMPKASRTCGHPGAVSRSLIRLRVAASSSGWVFKVANTHVLAAYRSNRCRAWPARSQSSASSPGVDSTAMAAAAGPPAGSKPRPRPRSKSRCGSRPSAWWGPAGKACAGTPSRSGLAGLRVHSQISARTRGSSSCSRSAAATCAISASRAGPGSISVSSAPSARASSRSRASSPAGSAPASNGPRCVCRCGSAASIFRSSAVMGAGEPSRTRASSRRPGGPGTSSASGRYPSERTASRSP